MIELIIIAATFLLAFTFGRIYERRSQESVQVDTPGINSMFHEYENIEPEKPSVETRLIQVIQEVDEPMTYLQLSSQMPAIDEKEVRDTLGKLVAEGKVVKKSAGHKGMYLKLNSFGKE